MAETLNRGDVVVIHTNVGLENRYGWIGIVLYDDTLRGAHTKGRYTILVCEGDGGHCSYYAKDLEVIDHDEALLISKEKMICYFYRNALEAVYCVEYLDRFEGWTDLVRKDEILRDLATLMLIHRDKKVAQSLKSHSKGSIVELAQWILDERDIEMVLQADITF
jgi:hypothetical protein